MEEIVSRLKGILMAPEEALREVKGEVWGVSEMMKGYVAILAAVPAAAFFVGLIGRGNFFRTLIFCGMIYGMGFVNVFVFGKIIDALAGYFNSTKSDLNAFKLSVYSMTPAFVAGLLNVNPSLNFLGTLVSLYGIYIFYLGLPILMETPEDKRVLYTVACIVAMVVVSIIVWSIVVALAWGSSYNPLAGY